MLRERHIPLYQTPKAEELRNAELEIFRSIQVVAFQREMKILDCLPAVTDQSVDRFVARERNRRMKRDSSLYRLDPFIHTDGLIHVGGRISQSSLSTDLKQPIILPRTHHVTTLVAMSR